ncbi:MAG: hypothetical protein KJN90_01435, partial [Gammaproteobacteria bacterium]|nr:hypothetical protein [Gammaproteobacteria bacterium]
MITEQIMRQLQGGLLGGGQGGFPQPMPQQSPAGALPAMPGQMQGMGLGSPFFTNRPQQGLLNPQPGFTPDRWNSMSPNAMAMMGMNPNMPNMVGPTSALPPEMQPQASQLRMYGMENQMAQPAPAASGQTGNGQSAPGANYNVVDLLTGNKAASGGFY